MYSKPFQGFDLQLGNKDTTYSIKLVKKVYTYHEALVIASKISKELNVNFEDYSAINKLKVINDSTLIEIEFMEENNAI